MFDETGVGQLAGELGKSLQRSHGIVAEQLASALDVDFGEGGGRGDTAQQRLELVEVTELGQRLDCRPEAEGVRTGEIGGGRPAAIGPQPAQVLAQLADLIAEAGVVEQCFGQPVQLVALLRRHRLEQRLHGRSPPGERLEQFVEVARLLREEVAVLRHELVEARILTTLVSSEHLVEIGEHLLEPLLGLLAQRLHRTAHLLERLRCQTGPQSLHQSVEPMLRLTRHEVVLLQGSQLAGEVVGKQVESQPALLGPAPCLRGASWIGPAVGLTAFLDLGTIDGVALLVDDVGELAGDLVVHAAEVRPLEPFPAGAAQPFEQLA